MSDAFAQGTASGRTDCVCGARMSMDADADIVAVAVRWFWQHLEVHNVAPEHRPCAPAVSRKERAKRARRRRGEAEVPA